MSSVKLPRLGMESDATATTFLGPLVLSSAPAKWGCSPDTGSAYAKKHKLCNLNTERL